MYSLTVQTLTNLFQMDGTYSVFGIHSQEAVK